jgi:glycosyltransferase involved in cell wall biosynthesis
MTYVLFAGVGPVPLERPPHQMAPGLRLWSLVMSALAEGVEGIAVTSYDHFGHRGDRDHSSDTFCEGVRVIGWPANRLQSSAKATLQALSPRCVVASTDLVAAELARQLSPDIPLWADLYGDPAAEGQLLAARAGHDGGLAPLASNVLALLTRADHFSVCSSAQRLALLGQLGLAGRLSAATCHRELVTVLPAMLVGGPPPPKPPPSPATSRLRGTLVGADDFVVLWSGGFNTWTDVGTLFEGLTLAMAREPRVRFVCLGGGIDRHNLGTYDEFVGRVERSPLRERFHLLGWRPQAEAAGFVAEADVGVNIDAVCHEAELGTRTRLLEWADAGLPIVSTIISEMSSDLAEAGGLEPFAVGNPESLAGMLVDLARDPTRRRRTGELGREFVRSRWTPEIAGKELAAWVRNPQIAPDRTPGAPWAGTNRLIAWMRALEPALRADAEPPADIAAQTRRLQTLEGSRFVRLRDWLRRRSSSSDAAPSERRGDSGE